MKTIQRLLAALRGEPTDHARIFADYQAAADSIETATRQIKSLRHPLALAVRAFRQSRNLSMREAAEKIGISAPYWSDIENAHRPITPALLKKLAKLFNL